MNLNALRNRPCSFYAPLAVIVLVLFAACGHQGIERVARQGHRLHADNRSHSRPRPASRQHDDD